MFDVLIRLIALCVHVVDMVATFAFTSGVSEFLCAYSEGEKNIPYYA
jgi:hypothetical protein